MITSRRHGLVPLLVALVAVQPLVSILDQKLDIFPLISNTLWLKYGLLLRDNTVVIVNGTGFVLNAYYLYTCYLYTKDPVRGSGCYVFCLSRPPPLGFL